MNALKDLLCENNSLSLTRAIALFGYLLFGVASLYMIITGTTWPDYATFAAYTGGAGAALQLGNKAINSKWNSADGSYKPIEDKDPDIVIPRTLIDKK